MPRRADPLRAQIKLLETHIKADKAERRAREKPLRDARRELSERLDRVLRTARDAASQLTAALRDHSFSKFIKPMVLPNTEHKLAQARQAFNARLLDLQAFDILHNIEADYPTFPAPDREAAIAAGRADYQRQMAEMRARFDKPSRCPPPTPSGPVFNLLPDTEDLHHVH